jgi:hypothetical protein
MLVFCCYRKFNNKLYKIFRCQCGCKCPNKQCRNHASTSKASKTYLHCPLCLINEKEVDTMIHDTRMHSTNLKCKQSNDARETFSTLVHSVPPEMKFWPEPEPGRIWNLNPAIGAGVFGPLRAGSGAGFSKILILIPIFSKNWIHIRVPRSSSPK